MLDKGTVQASNMQPYLSAINNYHEDMGSPGPAKGRAVSRAVKGIHVSAVHEHGLGLEPVGRAATELLRACTYAVFAFVTFGRPETGVSMRREHISITGDDISVVLHKEKGRGHVRLRRRLTIPAAGVAGLVQLLQHWQQVRDACWGHRPVTGSEVQGSYWRLPWEQGKLQSAQANGWVQLALGRLGCVPPEGGHFSGHSTRKGACTCARAVGAALEKCCFLGGWSQLSSAIHSYIDPAAVPDEHMEKYFGWTTPRWRQQQQRQPGTEHNTSVFGWPKVMKANTKQSMVKMETLKNGGEWRSQIIGKRSWGAKVKLNETSRSDIEWWARLPWGPHTDECFASEISAQLPRYYAVWKDPYEGVDSVAYKWQGGDQLVNPPWAPLNEVV
ncbi:hypothetical protein CYMTET_57097 [Cymbomonas tetramitiformis]|uniref:Uncharacterized protein n=1 Tax=Cymbomonas tetramitiformis TaxID=36881 RepID=A0AAE0BAS9_9CHLO|nr:hypothetical protein CYMTET_57097 [Cymbomonas tetramitiformis]